MAEALASFGFMNSHALSKADKLRKKLPELEETLAEAVTAEEVSLLLRTIYLRAISGEPDSMAAARLFLSYAYGRPKERMELTGADNGAINVDITHQLAKIYGNTPKQIE